LIRHPMAIAGTTLPKYLEFSAATIT
jgi:hypothetical protein